MYDPQFHSTLVPIEMVADQHIEAFRKQLEKMGPRKGRDAFGSELANQITSKLVQVFDVMNKFVEHSFQSYPGAPGTDTAMAIKEHLSASIGKKLDGVVAVSHEAFPGHLTGAPLVDVNYEVGRLKEAAEQLASKLSGP